MLKELLQELKERKQQCNMKTIATHKMTDQQKKLWQIYSSFISKTNSMEKLKNTSKKKFWNKVEGDINDFDHSLEVNEESWTIKVLEEKDQKETK